MDKNNVMEVINSPFKMSPISSPSTITSPNTLILEIIFPASPAKVSKRESDGADPAEDDEDNEEDDEDDDAEDDEYEDDHSTNDSEEDNDEDEDDEEDEDDDEEEENEDDDDEEEDFEYNDDDFGEVYRRRSGSPHTDDGFVIEFDDGYENEYEEEEHHPPLKHTPITPRSTAPFWFSHEEPGMPISK